MTNKSEAIHRSEDRSQALVLAAYHCIVEKGFEGLRVRDVAAQVGINPATLHYYFPTKEALVHGVVLYVTQRLAQTAATSEGSPKEQLRTHLHKLLLIMQAEPALFIALSELKLRALRDPTIRASGQQQVESWYEFLINILQNGIKQGQWPDDLDPEAVAAAIIALVQSVSLNITLLPNRVEQTMKQIGRWLNL